MKSRLIAALALCLCTSCAKHSSAPRPLTMPDEITRVDTGPDGSGGAGTASQLRLSQDGRYAVFSSLASDIAPDGRNNVLDIFRKDRLTGATQLVSKAWATAGTPSGDHDSYVPSISEDGMVIAFLSNATNLVAGDTNGKFDVFVVDLSAGTIERASVSSSGSQANDDSSSAEISGDGRYVAFTSAASNLVAGDTNGAVDVFRFDRVAPTTIRVSLDTTGAQAAGAPGDIGISRDGDRIVFDTTAALDPADGNGSGDIYLRSVAGGTTTRMSVSATGGDANAACFAPSISADGSAVAFSSSASNLVTTPAFTAAQVFIRRVVGGPTQIVSLVDGTSSLPASSGCGQQRLSGDGRYVIFMSGDLSLVGGNQFSSYGPEIFVRDRTTNRTCLVSANSAGTPNIGVANYPDMSSDGSTIGFQAEGSVLPGSVPTWDHVYAVPLIFPSGG